MLLDKQAQIVFRNSAADLFIQDASKPIQHSCIWELNADALNKCLRSITNAALKGEYLRNNLVLYTKQNAEELFVTISTLNAQAGYDDEPIAVLFISAAFTHEAPPSNALKGFFGLTPTEVRVAWPMYVAIQRPKLPVNIMFQKRR